MMSIEHQEDVQDLLMITLNQMIKKINNEREDTVNKVTNGVDVSAFL
jgi:DNA-binding protein YbaB